MRNPKSGFLTSEFLLTIITNIMGIAVISGVVTQELANDLQTHIAQIIAGMAMVITSAMYIYSRTVLKK